jgi:biotin operon repressor
LKPKKELSFMKKVLTSTRFKQLFAEQRKEMESRDIPWNRDDLRFTVGSSTITDSIITGALKHAVIHCYAVIYYLANLLGGDDPEKYEQELWEELRKILRECQIKILKDREERRKKRQENRKAKRANKAASPEPENEDCKMDCINNSNAINKRVTTHRYSIEKAVKYSPSNRQRKILDLLRKDTTMTYVDLSIYIGCARSAIAKDIVRLKELGLLKRVGSDKTGHWVASLPSSKS